MKNHGTSANSQFLAGNKRAANFLGGSDGSVSNDPLNGASPIADEYRDCTVFFAGRYITSELGRKELLQDVTEF